MDCTCIDSVKNQLSNLLTLPNMTSPMKQQIQSLQLELRFMKMFCRLAMWNLVADYEKLHLGPLQMRIEGTVEAAGKRLYSAGYRAIIGRDFKVWDLVAANFQERVDVFKPEIRETAIALFDLSSQFISFRDDEILEFVDTVLMNLKDFVSWKGEVFIDSVKKQIEALEEKLRFLRSFVDFIAKGCRKNDIMKDFLTTHVSHIQAWAKNCACLSLLCWIHGVDDDMAPQMKTVLPVDNLLKIMPCSRAVAEVYLELLKASESLSSDTLLMGEIVAGFVDLLIENALVSLKDDFAILLREGLTFLITILVDPPKETARERGNASVEFADMTESLVKTVICSLYIAGTEDGASKERNDDLSSLLERIEEVKAEVREFYIDMPNSSESNFPRTNGLGFIDFLMRNIRDMMQYKAYFVSLGEHKVMTVLEKLSCFRSFLQDTKNMRNDNQEVKALQAQIINVAYQVEHVMNSCAVVGIPSWCKIICLSDTLEEIKSVVSEITEMKQKYNIGKQSAETNSKLVHSSRGNNPKFDDVVGFKDEARQIIDLLTKGSDKLEIISIVGMPGVGKTTLARKVYTDPSIAFIFHLRAWCYVSQVYTIRDLLLNILKCVSEGIPDVQISTMSNEDLAAQLRKCLLKQRYLVVMDDIWNIDAWDAIKPSFPDDKKGSRIVFTTQKKNLNSDAVTYSLSPLIGEKPWEFLQQMLFHKVTCPEELSEIGKQIVRYCEGLPLAITVIAGLLAKDKDNVEWWEQVEASLNSDSTTEGYMGTLEISYKDLMDYLKPCFLYFGAFQKGEVISVRKLTLLWKAEGFIDGTAGSSFEVVTKKYLMELIDRSLVIASKRSSNGGIKACRVHDLLYKFCSEKATEEKLLHVLERSKDSDPILNPAKLNHYRLCVHSEWEASRSPKAFCQPVSSLLFFYNNRTIPSDIFNIFRLVKTLDLERVYLDSAFPEEIMSLVHLRYVSIWGHIREVPASIANLWNLETLFVKGRNIYSIHLPDTIWKMKSLKHVEVNEMAIISLGEHEFEESCLTDNIETFSTLALSSGGDAGKLLRRLRRLRKLRCVLLQSFTYRRNGIQFPELAFLEDLESLRMSPDVVSYNLMRSKIRAFNFPQNLKKLTLYKFGLPWSAISTIGKLAHLEVLRLREGAFRGQRWDVEDEQFLRLECLELSEMDIALWTASFEPFPKLERLVIQDCYQLEEIPFSFSGIFGLKLIQLRRCSYDLEDSAKQILQEQWDSGNPELDVVILH